MAKLIDGNALAAQVREEVAAGVKALAARGRPVGLAVVRVGEDPASAVYVRNKKKDAEQVGMASFEHHLDASVSREALLALVRQLNADPKVHGILVQLPLPKHLDADEVMDAIDPAKDADGFHPVNMGRLVQNKPGPRACTPFGVMRLLAAAGCDPAGKRALVIGRSNIVGKPMALLLLHANATVTVAHSKTPDLAGEVARADVVVAAVGKAQMVKGAWIKEGAVVIDVGMNKGADGKLVGDVEFAEAQKRASAITPVPGGVGPMTRAMLLWNTLELARAAK